MWSSDNGLFRSLQLAGSSFGIVTEFHYGLFEGPEVLPVYAFVYIENKKDLANFERAGINGRAGKGEQETGRAGTGEQDKRRAVN